MEYSSSLVGMGHRLTLTLLAGALLVSPSLPTVVLAQTAEFVPGRVIVKYRSGTPENRGAQLRAAVDAQVIKQLPLINAEVLTLPEGWEVDEIVEWYNGQIGVEYAEPDYLLYPIEGLAPSTKESFGNAREPPRAFATTPDDPRYSEQWALHNTGQSSGTVDADIDAPEAWDLTTGNDTIIVGVIDSGIDWSHPDLEANMWVNPGEIAGDTIDNDGNGFIDDIYGWDFKNDDASVYDSPTADDHGTHVAGTVAAVSDNALGVTGVAWNVKLMSLKFLEGSGSTSDAVDAINYAVANGATMTTNSWGGGGRSAALEDAIEASGDAGLLFIAASGNSAQDLDGTPSYPTAYPSDNIVSVNSTDRNDSMSSFSNYGLTTTDLAAPGSAILSTIPEGEYKSMSGTSMATPHVTGVAALIYSAFPELTHLQVKERLMWSGDAPSGLAGTSVSGRRLNAYNALDNDSIAPNAVADLRVVPDASPGAGSVTPFGGTALTLRWTAPGDDGAVGTASGYDLRYATTPITNDTEFDAAMQATGLPYPALAGTSQDAIVIGLDPETSYYFILKSKDNVSNQSGLSNSTGGETGLVQELFADGAESIASRDLWNIDLPWARTSTTFSPSDATAPLGGSWSWTDSPGGQYANNIDSSLETIPLSLEGVRNPAFQFDHRYDFENGWDFGYLEISTGDGAWTELKKYTGQATSWTSESVTLTDYAGQETVIFRFRVTSDRMATADGWYVDDVRLIGDADAVLGLDFALDASNDTAVVNLKLRNNEEVFGLSYQLSWGSSSNLTGKNPVSFFRSAVTGRLLESGLTHIVEVNTDTDVLTGTLVNTSGDGSIAAGDSAIIEYRFPLRDDLYVSDGAFVQVTETGSDRSGSLPDIAVVVPFSLVQGTLADSVGNPMITGLGGSGKLETRDLLNADVDFSGAVDVADIVSMIDFYLGRTEASGLQLAVADTYRDEILNVIDIVRTINIVLGRSIGNASLAAPLLAAGQQQQGRVSDGGDLDVAVQSLTVSGSALIADIPAGVVGLQLGIRHGPSRVSDAHLLLEDDGFELVKRIGATSSSFMIYSTDNSPLPPGTQPVLTLELDSGSGSGADTSVSDFYLSEVLGVDASGFPVYPNVDPLLAIQELLGTPNLLPAQKLQLDRRGNGDGVYNLGDLLSLLHRAGLFPGNTGRKATQ